MKFKISSDSLILFEQLGKTLKRNFFFSTFVFVVFSFLIYSTGKLDLSFYVTELILSIAFVIIGYYQIITKGNIINNTVLGIILLNNEIILITASFDIPFLVAKKPKKIRLQIDKMHIKKTNYPIKQIFDLDNGVYKIASKKYELYLIIDFFNLELKEKLEKYQ